MVIITCLYLAIVYLVFHKWKLLPWNKTTKGIAVVLGIIILTVFLVGLQGLTPASTQATITGPITEIAPQVSGRVINVPVQANVELLPNDVIFDIDPAPYQYRVDQLVAQLADTESAVAQLKEAHDAARSQTAATRAQLELTELRLRQSQELVAAGAGSRFELEQYESQELQLNAQLEAALAQRGLGGGGGGRSARQGSGVNRSGASHSGSARTGTPRSTPKQPSPSPSPGLAGFLALAFRASSAFSGAATSPCPGSVRPVAGRATSPSVRWCGVGLALARSYT